MKNGSSKQAISWIAAIAFILAYLFIVNPWASTLGVSRSPIHVVRASTGLLTEATNDTPGSFTIHTKAGSLVIGQNSSVTEPALEAGRSIVRLGTILFVPGE